MLLWKRFAVADMSFAVDQNDKYPGVYHTLYTWE